MSNKLSFNSQLIVVLVIIFTVSLTETIQIADGFVSKSTAGWVYELNPGESQVLTWTLTNSEEKPINIEFRAEGKGSELFVFEKLITFEPKEKKAVDFIVIVAADHPDNVEYHVDVFALERAIAPKGAAAAVLINYEMVAHPKIKIGDNPVFTPEPKPVVEEEPKPIIEERPSEEDFQIIATESTETLEEKFERIKAANEAKEKENPIQTQQVEEKIDDNGYVPEPIPDPEPTSQITEKSTEVDQEGGGCLIATATFGSELAPQVQFLREIRDNTLLSTSSGVSFMIGFNQLYYSFSPTIADLERESPIFKETIKLVLTPMLSTLSIMTLAEEGSESQVLGLGISVIALNLAMYIAAPAIIITRLRR